MDDFVVPGLATLHTPRHPADRRHAEHGLKDSGMAKNENKAIHGPVKPIRKHSERSSLRALECRRGMLFQLHETRGEGERDPC